MTERRSQILVTGASGQAGRIYELAGDEAFTLTEYVAEVSQQSGRTIEYRNVREDAVKVTFLAAGLPDALASMLTNSDTAAASGALFDDGRQLSTAIGRPTTPLGATVATALRQLPQLETASPKRRNQCAVAVV